MTGNVTLDKSNTNELEFSSREVNVVFFPNKNDASPVKLLNDKSILTGEFMLAKDFGRVPLRKLLER